MVIDPLLSLAISMQSNKGIYAFLIGSGVSRSAGIPTGWEVTLDLIRKLAVLTDEDCEPDPAEWYRRTFGEEPNYSKLLDSVAKAPAERNQLLRGYFEPNEKERENGLKVPSPAHHAVAGLVSAGYVRVIVTTNFDRLLEKALESAGVVPTVISTPDAADGAVPITHNRCSIIKLHGDYLDTRIKNNPDELEHYDKRMNYLLDRVLDEYGLVVCGWSAEWDTALRAAFQRCKSHRFTTFWATRDARNEHADRLVQLRHAETVRIKDADSFFQELSQKVSALEDLKAPHPLSAKVAVATLKKYLPDNRHRISLHDLVTGETEKLYHEFTDERFPLDHPPVDAANLVSRVQQYERLTEILLGMMITGCYWDEGTYQPLWVKTLDRIGDLSGARSGKTVWINLRLYPALLLLYGGGIASLVGQRYATFSLLLTKAKVGYQGGEYTVGFFLNTYTVMSPEDGRQLPGTGRRTPVSDHLFQMLREPLREILPSDSDYEMYFDRFEYLLALVCVWLEQKEKATSWGPIGCFGWRGIPYLERGVMGNVGEELTRFGVNWPLLKTGLFDGSLETLQSVKKSFDEFVVRLGW